MLPVGIALHNDVKIVLDGVMVRTPPCRTDSLIFLDGKNCRSGHAGPFTRSICRTVVDHEDWMTMMPGLGHD
jgi:hypothetical protein